MVIIDCFFISNLQLCWFAIDQVTPLVGLDCHATVYRNPDK